jgi:hypothetical protein
MTISNEEVISLFSGAYDIELEAAEIKKDAAASLKTYAENKDLDLKSVKQAYALYKKYRGGNVPLDDNTYDTLVGAVEEYFATKE